MDRPSPTRLVGTTLAERYDLIALLGAGGMGEVYRARDRELDEVVALKVIRDVDDAALDRFRLEVKLARRVTHVNVARTFELGQAAGLMFCTMELVEGESLQQWLARERKMPLADAVAIACAVCDALIAAHGADVIHRDIKPANVLLAPGGRVVLADFGIASLRVSSAADSAGTPAYMAPEQARGEPPTPAADVYAVGVLLYELVTGQRAFTGNLGEILLAKQDVERLVPPAADAPPELVAAISRATARELDERFSTAAELRLALAPWAGKPPERPVARVAHVSIDERTVFVVAPRAPTNPRLHVAEAIHEELLAVLARGRGVRVLPRVELGAPTDGIVVRFAVDASITMSVQRAGDAAPAVTLELPATIEHLPRSVALAAAAVETLVGAPLAPLPAIDAEVTELVVKARQQARMAPALIELPLALLERANERRPHDPQILANIAILNIRAAFFMPDLEVDLLGRARRYIREALALGPDVADAQLAAGHLELHTGDPALAAAHYRTAIARAPYSAEAHDMLGKMLLEAGYLDAALARLETATAISPEFHSARWEIARAMALEQRWDEHEAIIGPLESKSGGRPIARARFKWWRNDLSGLRELRENHDLAEVFDNDIAALQLEAFLDGGWPRVKDDLMRRALVARSPSKRRSVFVAQLVAETAGYAGDVEACVQVIEHAAELGLFDLHWIDRCPSIAVARSSPRFAAVRVRIEERARRIYDALYCDLVAPDGETALATE